MRGVGCGADAAAEAAGAPETVTSAEFIGGGVQKWKRLVRPHRIVHRFLPPTPDRHGIDRGT